MRPINMTRNTHGEGNLVNEMRLFDEETHFPYFPMSRRKFDQLLHLVGPEIEHSRNHILPIDPLIRLAITLRFLASGNSFVSIAHSYRTNKSTVRLIVYEVCETLWKILQPMHLTAPTKEKWMQIAQQIV